MGHQRDIDVPEIPFPQHDGLPHGRLLRRGPVHHDLRRGILPQTAAKGGRGPQHRRPLHMVAAAVSKALKRVVLAQKADGRAAGPHLVHRPKSGGKSRDPRLNRKPLIPQERCQPLHGVPFLPTAFRVVENVVGQSAQLPADGINICSQLLLQPHPSSRYSVYVTYSPWQGGP